jgi:hypothetical protein
MKRIENEGGREVVNLRPLASELGYPCWRRMDFEGVFGFK